MPDIPTIDLHPSKVGGKNADLPIFLARSFLLEALAKGLRDVRIITGLGIHGDGTPRLRSRVEREVLLPLATKIRSQHYEQGGAVIRLELEAEAPKPGSSYYRQQERQQQLKSLIGRESRFLIAEERLEAANAYLDEGDLRRCRLKLNQILREYFPGEPLLGAQLESLEKGLGRVESLLRKKIEGEA
jgi:hypothetical protein